LGPRCLADERLALCRPPSVAIERTGPESGTMVILSDGHSPRLDPTRQDLTTWTAHLT
jgi:hypothetical protein